MPMAKHKGTLGMHYALYRVTQKFYLCSIKLGQGKFLLVTSVPKNFGYASPLLLPIASAVI